MCFGMPQPRKTPLKRRSPRDASLQEQIRLLRETVERAEAVLVELQALGPDLAFQERAAVRRRARISIH
jgi:hypothetical protein